MLSHEENEFLVRSGPGTPMGNLVRRYWIPMVQSGELFPGGRVKRVQLLGERLIAYRTPDGAPGLIGEYCPHRGASLFFGRVEEAGMRCADHGWKFGLDGQCVDMPSEPAEASFAGKVWHTGYPCAEGGIDSSHISFLHAPVDHTNSAITRDMDRVSFGVGAAVQTGDRAPHFEVVDTDYGVLIGARRTQPDGQWYWRITQFLMPFHTMPPTDLEEKIVQSHIWVPMDDAHVVNWMVTWHPERPLTAEEVALQIAGKGAHVCNFAPATSEPYGDIRTAANRDNDYFMDWEAHRSQMFCGIPGFGVQDQAVQESQGLIVDRTQERLGTSDTAIIQVRKRMMSAARALRERGERAPGLDGTSFLVRSASAVLAPGADWVEGAKARILVRPGQSLTVV